MVDIIAIVHANLLTPIVLFFILGIIAARVKSDLRIPEAISSMLPIYLLAAIGLHGGIEMRKTGLENIVVPMLVAISLSITMTLYHYQILRRLGKFNIFDSYALASTYGAVGAVAFSVGLSFLQSQNIESEGYLTAVLAVLEPISFILSIFLVNVAVAKNLKKKGGPLIEEKPVNPREEKEGFSGDANEVMEPVGKLSHSSSGSIIQPPITAIEVGNVMDSRNKAGNMRQILVETMTGKSIVILIGSIVIGYAVGERGFESIKIAFQDLFTGALVIFLLEMGIIAGQRLGDIKKVGPFLVVFAIVIPTLNGTIGAVVANALGLSIGGTVMFAMLMASASFIAGPAIFRTAIPRANPSLYITSALGITFPYIIIALLPVLLILSTILHGGSPAGGG